MTLNAETTEMMSAWSAPRESGGEANGVTFDVVEEEGSATLRRLGCCVYAVNKVFT